MSEGDNNSHTGRNSLDWRSRCRWPLIGGVTGSAVAVRSFCLRLFFLFSPVAHFSAFPFQPPHAFLGPLSSHLRLGTGEEKEKRKKEQKKEGQEKKKGGRR